MVEMDHIYEDQAKAELAKDPEPRTIEQWLLQGEKDERFTIEDIAQHGCEGGVGGLIYYSETEEFHDKFEEEIWDLVKEFADDSGQHMLQYMSNVLGDKVASVKTLKNYLAWFAVEVMASRILGSREDAKN